MTIYLTATMVFGEVSLDIWRFNWREDAYDDWTQHRRWDSGR